MAKRYLDLRPAVATGISGGAVAVLMALVGMVEALSKRDVITGVISVGYTLLLLGFLFTGGVAAGRLRDRGAPAAIGGAALAGAINGGALTLLALIGGAVNLRRILLQATPRLFDLIRFEQDPPAGLLVPVILGAAAGALGALFALLPPRWRRPLSGALLAVLFAGLFEDLLEGILLGASLPRRAARSIFNSGLTLTGTALFAVAAAAMVAAHDRYRDAAARRIAALPEVTRKGLPWALVAAGVALLLILPLVVGNFLSFALVMVGLYALMGWGLNLELGWAGLLDLGFVAFFAIGAYTVAILTSPESVLNLGIPFWATVPVAVVVSILAGALLGIPVLGMRGDYLAIATLGFGEIVRLLVLSEWLRPWTGGSQGIRKIPNPTLSGMDFNQPSEFYYLVLVGCALALLVAGRLRDSRLGRAWLAIREDEDVAQAMGINLVSAKLLAYGLGAGFAGLAGAIFAAMLGTVFPHSFQVLISINVVSLIVVGGMGSLPGVAIGSLALVGLPELLREFDEFRLLIYGAVLIVMMLVRPEGLVPERHARRQFRAAARGPDARAVPLAAGGAGADSAGGRGA